MTGIAAPHDGLPGRQPLLLLWVRMRNKLVDCIHTIGTFPRSVTPGWGRVTMRVRTQLRGHARPCTLHQSTCGPHLERALVAADTAAKRELLAVGRVVHTQRALLGVRDGLAVAPRARTRSPATGVARVAVVSGAVAVPHRDTAAVAALELNVAAHADTGVVRLCEGSTRRATT